jgi:hypothetical protein
LDDVRFGHDKNLQKRAVWNILRGLVKGGLN